MYVHLQSAVSLLAAQVIALTRSTNQLLLSRPFLILERTTSDGGGLLVVHCNDLVSFDLRLFIFVSHSIAVDGRRLDELMQDFIRVTETIDAWPTRGVCLSHIALKGQSISASSLVHGCGVRAHAQRETRRNRALAIGLSVINSTQGKPRRKPLCTTYPN
jgi:hypothetical protein